MKIFICSCGYIFMVDDSAPIPRNVMGPIFPPDTIISHHWWMFKPRLMNAYEWYENYADCAASYMKEVWSDTPDNLEHEEASSLDTGQKGYNQD